MLAGRRQKDDFSGNYLDSAAISILLSGAAGGIMHTYCCSPSHLEFFSFRQFLKKYDSIEIVFSFSRR
jgi:hypothetical protein